MMRRASLVLSAAMALALAACAGSTADDTSPSTEPATSRPGTSDPAPAAGGEVTIGLQLEPGTLDLTSSPAAGIPQTLLNNVYETLVKLEADGSFTPQLAESYEISDDGLVYTFALREGVTFHNGDPLTVEDVVFSIDHVLTKEPAHPFATTLAPIESVEAIDESTVQLTLNRVSSNLLYHLTQSQGVILTESALDSIENEPVGTGPFVFESWTVGDSIVLQRNPDYWGEPAPLETVTFRYIPDPNALANAMLSDDLHILAGLSAPELMSEFEGDDRFETYVGESHGEVVLSLNGRRPPLDDVRVRRAVSHAVDRQAVIDLAYAGYGTPIGTFSTPLDPWFLPLTEVYPYDPERARDLLAEAGAEGASLEMILPPTSYATRAGEVVASQLAEVGLTANITNVEFPVWLEDVFANHDFDMSIVAHVEPRDLAQYGNPDYYWGNDSPGVADLLVEADSQTDNQARDDLYRQVLTEITDQAADQWLFVLPNLSITRSGVTGYEIESASLSLDVTALDYAP